MAHAYNPNALGDLGGRIAQEFKPGSLRPALATQQVPVCTKKKKRHSFKHFFFFLMEFCSCCPGWGVQWCNLSSLQPPPPGFKQLSCLSPPGSWDYRCTLPCLANFCIFSRDEGFTMLARLVLNSWPQVIHPPQPSRVLGLQAWATMPGPSRVLQIFFKANVA